MRGCDVILPEFIFRPMRMLGTWVAVATLPAQRAHSRAYLAVVLGRPPRVVELWRHFFAFAEFLLLLLRTGRGALDTPGLVLGLDFGGCCNGVAFRIAAAQARHELTLIWRREMAIWPM